MSLIPIEEGYIIPGSSEVYQQYDPVSRTFQVSRPYDDNYPSVELTPKTASTVDEIRFNHDCGVNKARIRTTSDTGEDTIFHNVLVRPDGQLALPTDFPHDSKLSSMNVQLTEPTSEWTTIYSVTVTLLSCNKEATTTIVAPSTTTVGQTVPSTTTTMTSQAIETLPTTTTTLSTTSATTEVGTTTSIAVVTTTTTPTGSTTIVVCPQIDQMVTQTALLDESHFKSSNSDDPNPVAVQPPYGGWKPAVARDGSPNPGFCVELADDASNSFPPMIASVTIKDFTLLIFRIVFYFGESEIYNAIERMPVSGSKTVVPSEESVAVRVNKVCVELMEANSPSVLNYETTMLLKGCLEAQTGELNITKVSIERREKGAIMALSSHE